MIRQTLFHDITTEYPHVFFSRSVMEKSSIPQFLARPGVALIAIEVLWFYVPWRGLLRGLVVNLLGD